MKKIFIILLAVICIACKERASQRHVVQDKNLLVEQEALTEDTTCYWHDLRSYLTPQGVKIDYRLVDDRYYFLQWEKDNRITVLPDTFFCDSPPPLQPRFEDENGKYVFLRFNCGSSCWGGIVLPLYEGGKAETFMHHLGYDLEDDLIATADFDESEQKAMIIVSNLKSGQIQKIPIMEDCASAVPSYCVDSLSIRDKTLYFKWNPETYINLKKGLEKKIKLKI